MKKLMSPMKVSGHAGNNMVPTPKSSEGIDVPQKHRGPHLSAGSMPAPGCGSLGRPQYSSATPDMKGTLFGHKKDSPGV
jgi:hypothetical protein